MNYIRDIICHLNELCEQRIFKIHKYVKRLESNKMCMKLHEFVAIICENSDRFHERSVIAIRVSVSLHLVGAINRDIYCHRNCLIIESNELERRIDTMKDLNVDAFILAIIHRL